MGYVFQRKKHWTDREMGRLFIQWLYFTTDIHKVAAVVGKYESMRAIVRIAAVRAPTPTHNRIHEKRRVHKKKLTHHLNIV